MKSFLKRFSVLTLALAMCFGAVGCKENIISKTTGRVLLYAAVSIAYNEAVNNGIKIGEQRVDFILDRIDRIKRVMSAVESDEPLPDVGVDLEPLLTVEVFTNKRAAKRFAIDIGIALAYQYAVERGAELPKDKLRRTYEMLSEIENAILFATGRTSDGVEVLSVDEEPAFELVLTR